MNERILELAEQATTIVEMVGPQGYASSYANFDREKFALLIVKECAGIVEDAVNHREPASIYVDKIKKHFGVEE